MKKYLSVTLGGNNIHLELECVLEAIESYEYRVIPDQKKGMLGITSYRGDLIPIIGIGEHSFKKNLIILNHNSKIAGLAVTNVKGIDTLNLIGPPERTDITYVEQFESKLVLNIERLMESAP